MITSCTRYWSALLFRQQHEADLSPLTSTTNPCTNWERLPDKEGTHSPICTSFYNPRSRSSWRLCLQCIWDYEQPDRLGIQAHKPCSLSIRWLDLTALGARGLTKLASCWEWFLRWIMQLVCVLVCVSTTCHFIFDLSLQEKEMQFYTGLDLITDYYTDIVHNILYISYALVSRPTIVPFSVTQYGFSLLSWLNKAMKSDINICY